MPLYEYACPSCAAVFTRLRPMSASAEGTACPDCATLAPRTLTAFTVHRGGDPPAPAAASVPPVEGELCRRYPHLPLLCHMEPKAAERWIAKAEGREEQYLERQARQQEAATRVGLPPAPPADGQHAHHNHPGHHMHAQPVTPATETAR